MFQPPFQLGRISPEQGLQPLLPEKPEPPAKSSCTAAAPASESGDGDRVSHLLPEPQPSPPAPELHPELGDTSTVRSKVLAARSSFLSLDSDFSEHPLEALGEGHGEKEPSYERALKPEGEHPASGCCSCPSCESPGQSLWGPTPALCQGAWPQCRAELGSLPVPLPAGAGAFGLTDQTQPSMGQGGDMAGQG